MDTVSPIQFDRPDQRRFIFRNQWFSFHAKIVFEARENQLAPALHIPNLSNFPFVLVRSPDHSIHRHS